MEERTRPEGLGGTAGLGTGTPQTCAQTELRGSVISTAPEWYSRAAGSRAPGGLQGRTTANSCEMLISPQPEALFENMFLLFLLGDS